MFKDKIPDIEGYAKEDLLWLCENTYGSSIFKEYKDVEDWDVLVAVIAKKDRAKWEKRRPQHYSDSEEVIELVDNILILMVEQDKASVLEIERLMAQAQDLTKKVDGDLEELKLLVEQGNNGDNIKSIIDAREALHSTRKELAVIKDEQVRVMTELLALRHKIIERNEFIINLRVAAIEPATNTTQ